SSGSALCSWLGSCGAGMPLLQSTHGSQKQGKSLQRHQHWHEQQNRLQQRDHWVRQATGVARALANGPGCPHIVEGLVEDESAQRKQEKQYSGEVYPRPPGRTHAPVEDVDTHVLVA